MEPRFDLATEAWIPCRAADGSACSVGLAEALVRSHELAAIAHPNPLVAMGIHRVLLALLHRVVEGPRNTKEWKRGFGGGRIPESDVAGYFRRWNERFDLFSPGHPFYQTAGLAVLDAQDNPSPVPITSILHPATLRLTVFEHRRAEDPPELSPPEAAAALVAWQLYGFGGLNRKTTNLFGYQPSFFHAPLVGGIATMLVGRTLFETLWLNTLILSENSPMPESDSSPNVPPWERQEERRQGSVAPAGYLDHLVPYSRHMRLVPHAQGSAILVSHLHIAQAVKYEVVKGERVHDPMHHERQDRKDPRRWYPPSLRAGRALWRESSAIFAFVRGAEADQAHDHRPMAFRQFDKHFLVEESDPMTPVMRCTTFALGSDKANPLLWRQETLSFPARLIQDEGLVAELVEGLGRAEEVGSGVERAAAVYAREALGKNPIPKDVDRLARAIGAAATYWGMMEVPFRRWLACIGTNAGRTAFSHAVREKAEAAFARCIETRQSGADRYYRAVALAERGLRRVLARSLPEQPEEVRP